MLNAKANTIHTIVVNTALINDGIWWPVTRNTSSTSAYIVCFNTSAPILSASDREAAASAASILSVKSLIQRPPNLSSSKYHLISIQVFNPIHNKNAANAASKKRSSFCPRLFACEIRSTKKRIPHGIKRLLTVTAAMITNDITKSFLYVIIIFL